MKNYQNYSMDDIIFENRNKAYGAYQLRQITDRNTTYGLMATTTAILVFMLITVLLPDEKQQNNLIHPITIETNNLEVELIRPKAPSIKAPKKMSHAATVPTKAFTAINPVETLTKESSVAKQTELLTAMVGTENNNEVTAVAAVSSETLSEGKEMNNTVTEIPEKQKIEKWVEVMPAFIGGNEALMKYLKNNIKMDNRDVAEGISGKVTIQFYVDIDGSIKEAKVIKDTAGGRCAERALAAINNMPKWNPGKQGNKAVRVYHTIPITFQVN